MAERINRVRNEDFTAGKAGPRSWVLESSGKGVTWHREETGVQIVSEKDDGLALWWQDIVVTPGDFYRVEAEVTCDVSACDESAGCVVTVQPLLKDKAIGAPSITPGVHRCSTTTAIRALYEVPDGVRRVRLSVGLVGARGSAWIRRVHFLSVLEPDETSHSISVPPPAHTLRAPKTASRIAVCSQAGEKRPLVDILTARFTKSGVTVVPPDGYKDTGGDIDALLFPDGALPASIRTLTALEKLAADRIVLVSLSAWAKLAGEDVSVRVVRQPDDLLYAKVIEGDDMTRGFAMGDVFPWDWSGRQPGERMQRQLKTSAALEALLTRRGYRVMLASMGNKEATSDRPICLRRQSSGDGALIVMDVEPVEAQTSTASQTSIALHVLLAALGHRQSALGQYVSPSRKEWQFREVIRQMGVRLPHVVVHDAEAPVDEITEQLVTVGGEDSAFGLSASPKPVILVRSHLHGGDVESAYGSLLWFKQLTRMVPHICPYAESLVSRFQLAWQPCVAPWEARDGWQRSRTDPPAQSLPDFGEARVACMIDVVSVPANRLRVVVPSETGGYERYTQWLAALSRAFPPGAYYAMAPELSASWTDRDQFAWRRTDYPLEVAADARHFDESIHRAVCKQGGDVVRIEVPGCDADFVANSIQRSDLVATTLEHVIGLQYGLIAVNRSDVPAKFDGFAPVITGGALLVDREDLALQSSGHRAG